MHDISDTAWLCFIVPGIFYISILTYENLRLKGNPDANENTLSLLITALSAISLLGGVVVLCDIYIATQMVIRFPIIPFDLMSQSLNRYLAYFAVIIAEVVNLFFFLFAISSIHIEAYSKKANQTGLKRPH